MRRFTAAFITCCLMLQSSGMAMAGIRGTNGAPSMWDSFSLATRPIVASVVGPYAGQRRQPPPGRAIVTPAPVATAHATIGQRPLQRSGIYLPGPHMLATPLPFKENRDDPRAMGAPAQSTSAKCGNSLLRACAQATPSSARPFSVLSPFSITPVQARSRAAVHTMAVPTVQQFQYEADTTAGPTVLFVTASAESGAVSRLAQSAPAHAPATQTLTFSPTSSAMSFGWVTPSNVPNLTSWPAQNYTVTLNVTQPNANLKITEITLYRVDSTGGPGSGGIAHVADKSGLSQSLGSAGTYTWTLSGTAQTASATDRFGIKFIVSYSGTASSSFGYSAGSGSGSGVNLSGSGGLPTATTGINPWWTFFTGALPGQGGYAINVGNGNLLAKALDADTPERGIDLAFERVYNSLSTHDTNNTDGSVPGDYGDGWTTSFDAHLAYHGSNTISVYDIDGTRYDYTADGSGHWTPPAGEYASLKWDGACGYQWFKTDGTVYYFYSPDLNESASCSEPYPQDSAYGGRLYQIWARNYNNKITFSYSWSGGNATSPANLTGVTAAHADGDKMTLTFGTVNGVPELASLTRPDGKVISYAYNGNNLSEVDLPGTNGPGSSAISTIKETYQYGSSSHLLTTVISPAYNQSSGANGDQTVFAYDGSNRVTQVKDSGVVNFAPSDGTGTALQGGSTGITTWTTTNFTWLGGETELSDMFGRYANWFFDGSARVTETQRWSFTPSGSGVWLSAAQSWDANNNLLSSVDPRGMVGATPDPTYETDYAYDTVGDVVAVAQPSVGLNNGTYRPTYVYSYDSNHNITAVCDPVQSHALGLDWNGTGQNGNPGTSNTRCASSTGSERYTWDTSDANEPYGRVSNYYTANGYHYAVACNAASEGNVDAGLPTSITGDPISQSVDSATPRTPTQSITYDAMGNVISINNGKGNTTFAYDAMHREISTIDADSVGRYGCFNDNGTLLYTETASQHAADGSPSACSTPLPASLDVAPFMRPALTVSRVCSKFA